MSKITKTLALALFLFVCVNSSNAQTPGTHLQGDLTASMLNDSWWLSGKLVGLGNAAGAQVHVTATVEIQKECVNPSGKKVVPGQSRTAEVDFNHYFSANNGMINFQIPPVKETTGCPNGKWSITVLSAVVTSASISVDGTVVHQQ